jgi:hypothetical protein
MKEICTICNKPSVRTWNGVGNDHKECQRESWKQRNLDIVSRGVRIAVKLGMPIGDIVKAHDEAMAAGYGIPIESWLMLARATRDE